LNLLVFGCGYLGGAFARRMRDGGEQVTVTARSPEKREDFLTAGYTVVDPADDAAMAEAAGRADAVLITAAPDAEGCPGLRALVPALARAGGFPGWVGYVSTTGVYGDRGGGWVFEDSELNAASLQGARRAAAERDWFEVGGGMGLTVAAFRLPAIYGPGRSPFARLRDGTARRVRKPGQVFNRIHLDDAVNGIAASLAKPRPGAAYNLADDEPAGADVYVEYAAQLLGLPPPPEADWMDAGVGEGMRRFYLDNKRISNALAKAELGWRPAYADWRDGLRAILAGEG
jgi:nucleoside-diphosphate-sugar epimerase